MISLQVRNSLLKLESLNSFIHKLPKVLLYKLSITGRNGLADTGNGKVAMTVLGCQFPSQAADLPTAELYVLIKT